MGLLRRTEEKGEPEEAGKQIGTLITHVAVHECTSIASAWNSSFTDQGSVVFFAEYAAILLAVVDRLAYAKLGDPQRATLMESAIGVVEECFSNQKHFGNSPAERAEVFSGIIGERLALYGNCSGIMSGDEQQLVWQGACVLVRVFARDAGADSEIIVLDTAKELTQTIAALLTTPCFKRIT